METNTTTSSAAKTNTLNRTAVAIFPPNKDNYRRLYADSIKATEEGSQDFAFIKIDPFQKFPIHIKDNEDKLIKTFYVIETIVFAASEVLKNHYFNRLTSQQQTELTISDIEPEHFELFLRWLYITESDTKTLDKFVGKFPVLEPLDKNSASALLFTANRFGVKSLIEIASPFVARFNWASVPFEEKKHIYPEEVERQMNNIIKNNLNIFAVREVVDQIKDLSVCKDLLHATAQKFYSCMCALVHWFDLSALRLHDHIDSYDQSSVSYEIEDEIARLESARTTFGKTFLSEADMERWLSPYDYKKLFEMRKREGSTERDATEEELNILANLRKKGSPLQTLYVVPEASIFDHSNFNEVRKIYEAAFIGDHGPELPASVMRLINNPVFKNEPLCDYVAHMRPMDNTKKRAPDSSTKDDKKETSKSKRVRRPKSSTDN